MFSISHLILIFLVALIVFGPEKLPELARALSKAMLEFNRVTGGFKQTLQEEMRQLEREIAERNAGPAAPARSYSGWAEPEVSSEGTMLAETAGEPAAGTAKPVPGCVSEQASEGAAGGEIPEPDSRRGNPADGDSTAV